LAELGRRALQLSGGVGFVGSEVDAAGGTDVHRDLVGDGLRFEPDRPGRAIEGEGGHGSALLPEEALAEADANADGEATEGVDD